MKSDKKGPNLKVSAEMEIQSGERFCSNYGRGEGGADPGLCQGAAGAGVKSDKKGPNLKVSAEMEIQSGERFCSNPS